MSALVVAQEKKLNEEILDSLQSLKYFELYTSYIGFQEKDVLEANHYAKAYLKKAKKEQDTFFIAHGWSLIADLNILNPLNLIYADSIVRLTADIQNKEYPARGYVIKGNYFSRKQLFSEALYNYSLASQFAMQKTNPKIIYDCNKAVGRLYANIGLNNKALVLFKEVYAYSKDKELETQLEDLYYMSREFNALKLVDSAAYYNAIGIRKVLKTDLEPLYNFFIVNSGITKYNNMEYSKTVDSISKVLPYLTKNNRSYHLIISYLYLGKAYDKLNKKDESYLSLKKMDSIIGITEEIVPNIIDGYELLINNCKERNISKEVLIYKNQRLKMDSILNHIYTDSLKKVLFSYKTPNIISKDDRRIGELSSYKSNFQLSIYLSVITGFLMIALLIYLYKDRNQYKKSFNAIVVHANESSNDTEPTVKKANDKQLENLSISQETVDVILKGIGNFEKTNRYLKSKYSLSLLAKEINTNSSYLSKVINIYKGKNFSNYLHDLRIGYAIDRLKDDRQFRLYSIKGISEEVGFKSSESFSKAFHKKTGIYPSAFIKKLKST